MRKAAVASFSRNSRNWWCGGRHRSNARPRLPVCGEMAGDPAFTETLLGMGLARYWKEREFSTVQRLEDIAREAGVPLTTLATRRVTLRQAALEHLSPPGG